MIFASFLHRTNYNPLLLLLPFVPPYVLHTSQFAPCSISCLHLNNNRCGGCHCSTWSTAVTAGNTVSISSRTFRYKTQCVWRNIAVWSCDGCSCGKPVILNSILALVTRHANRIFLHRIVLPRGLSGCYHVFPHFLTNSTTWGGGGVTEHKMF